MSSFADSQTLDGSDESYSVPEIQPKRSWLQRVRDWLWGYDFFVSYHWASGGPYAVNLAQRLRDAKYDVFLDRAEYAMGDDWKKVGAYALSNTQRLILVATREAVTDSKPVEREVQLFTDKNRQVIPIVFGDDLQELDWKKLEVLSRMEDSMLRISEDVHSLASGPSDAAIDQLVKTHGLMRRRTLRRWIISILITLISVSALVAGYQRQVAVEEARKANLQLAKSYIRQGSHERDINKDFLMSSHYFIQAAIIGDKANEPRLSISGRILADFESRKLPINWGQFDIGIEGMIKGVLYSQFNRRLFMWGKNRGTQLWNTSTHRIINAPILKDNHVDGALLSKDEKWLLTWSSPSPTNIWGFSHKGVNGIAQIWDIQSGDPISDPMLHDFGVKGASFSHDQNQVLTWDWNNVRVWDRRTGNALSKPMKHKNSVLGAKFSDKQKVILSWTASLSGGSGGMARVWDKCSGDIIFGPVEHEDGIDGGNFSQDLQQVVTWDKHSVKIWNYINERTSTPITIYPEAIGDIKNSWFTKYNNYIITWGSTHYQVWNSKNGKPLSKEKKHSKAVFDPLIKEDAKLIENMINDGIISEWNRLTDQSFYLPVDFSEKLETKVKLAQPDNQQKVSWNNKNATIWGIPSTQSRPLLAFKGGGLNSFRLADVLLALNQRWVLTWDRRSTGQDARIWDSYTGDPLSESITHDQFIDEAPSWGFGKIQLRESIYSGKSIVDTTGSRSTRDGPRINQDQHLGMPLKWKAMGESLEVRNVRTEKLLFDPITHKGGIQDVLVTQDRKRGLIWGSRQARVWDFITGEPLSAPMKHGGELIDGVQFSNDQLRVLTWGGRTAQIWDSYTGQALFAPMVHKHDVNGAMFTNDEQRVLTWSKWGMVRIWNLGVDLDFPLQYLPLQLEVKTRRRVTEKGDAEELTEEEWSNLWLEYENIARMHLKNCQYPRANWYIDRMLHQPGSCEQPGDWLGDVNKDSLDEVKEIYASHCEERGRTLLLGGHYQQAKRSFETALRLKPKNVFAHDGLARILIESGEDPYKGVEYAKQSLELNTRQAPKYALATLVKGYTSTGQDHKAALAGLKLARTFFRWGEYQHALDAYNQVFNTEPELREQLDPDECKKALEMLPKFMRTKEDVGALEIMFSKDLQTGFNARRAGKLASNLIDREIDISKGIAYARRSLELDPEQPVNFAISILARGYIKQGRHEEAINILENALETASDKDDIKVLNRALKKIWASNDKANFSDKIPTPK